MSIIWSSLYRVGVKEIDEQHRHFFDLINEAYQAKDLNDPEIRLPYILKELIAYAGYHFANEEKYFDLFKYERAEEHKKEHRGFEEKIKSIKERYDNGDKEIISELVEFLENWLTNHISYSDKLYRKCFHEHGLV